MGIIEAVRVCEPCYWQGQEDLPDACAPLTNSLRPPVPPTHSGPRASAPPVPLSISTPERLQEVGGGTDRPKPPRPPPPDMFQDALGPPELD